MKNKQSPTRHERVMRDQDFIVSKTDLKGRITYCNRVFIEFAGYDEHELMGEQHNIVRHPDMPRGVFKYLWDTLAQKKEVFAYVLNP
jgi:PAS domain S-box-containing protein